MSIDVEDSKTIKRVLTSLDFRRSAEDFPRLLNTSLIQVHQNKLTANLYSLYYLSFRSKCFYSSRPSSGRTKYRWRNAWNTTHLGIHLWYRLYLVLIGDGSKEGKRVGENGTWCTILKLNVILFPWTCINNCFAKGEWKIVSFYCVLSHKVN